MKHTRFLGIIFLTLATGLCFGMGNKVKTEPASENLFDYEQITLDNGLEVITLEDFSCPIVCVNVWYHVGSKDENPERKGYAHLFEHMMFKGTDHVGDKDHFNLLRKVGGECNAYTSFDQTVYHETLPANQLDLALWLEAERMSFLKIDQDAFDTERKVVEEELRMRENQPYGTLFKKINEAIYTVHPYRWTPIGNLANLRATSVPDLRQFWTENYVPNNATLVIVGAVKHKDAQKLAKEYFGWIPAGPEPKRITVKEPPLKEAKQIVIDNENAPLGQVMLTWRTVPTGTREETALDLLSRILGRGPSSRIYRKMVAEEQVAVEAGTWGSNMKQDGTFTLFAVLPPMQQNNNAAVNSYAALLPMLQDYDTPAKMLLEQLEKVKSEGVTEEELEKARNQSLKTLVAANLEIESKARLLGTAAVTMGDVSKVNTFIDEIKSITNEDIKAVANKYLRKDRMYEFIIQQNQNMDIVSKDNEEAGITAKPELNPPAPGRPGVKRPADFPKTAPLAKKAKTDVRLNFEEKKLSNGLKVQVIPNHEVPFISVSLGLTNGAWTETKPGTAVTTLSMLTKGTQSHSEAQLAAELDQYAISLGGSADIDTAMVNMDCVTDQLDRGMSLLAEVIKEPTFSQDEFSKLMNQQIAGQMSQEKEPRYLAGKYFNKILFGEHPYGRTVEGSVKDLQQLTVEDLRQWWGAFARPDQASLIFAGDITQEKAIALAKQYLGDWEAKGPKPTVEVADIPKQADRQIYLVNLPGSVQAEIRVGELGITRHQQPDYFIGLITGNYFGGSFNSRLNENLRVKRGLTYGSYAGFAPKQMAGTFMISTFTKNESAAESIKVILEQVDELRTVIPTDEEFYDTRSYLTGSFAKNRETPQSVARDLWMIESQGLTPDYLSRLFKGWNKATKQDCLDFAKKTIKPDKLAIVVVGDAEKLKDSLEKIAPVEVIEPNGK